MAETTYTFEIDSELKERFEELCNSLGLDMNTAFIMFLEKSLECGVLPFRVTLKPQ